MKNSKHSKVYRVIDVNFNRTREGLRVIEDTLRFIFDDKKLFRRIRVLRHRLTATARKIYPVLVKSRNIDTDFGKRTKEKKYRDINNIVVANCRRIQESLRVLEEYSRLISSSASKQFKNIRFEVYRIEKIGTSKVLRNRNK